MTFQSNSFVRKYLNFQLVYSDYWPSACDGETSNASELSEICYLISVLNFVDNLNKKKMSIRMFS